MLSWALVLLFHRICDNEINLVRKSYDSDFVLSLKIFGIIIK